MDLQFAFEATVAVTCKRFGLSFASLTLTTNTVWIAVAVHIAFDLFTDLPNATAGVSGR
jgi:hypothetical protein